jgi:hypothetical protein
MIKIAPFIIVLKCVRELDLPDICDCAGFVHKVVDDAIVGAWRVGKDSAAEVLRCLTTGANEVGPASCIWLRACSCVSMIPLRPFALFAWLQM